MRTRMVASEPSTMMTRLSGTVARKLDPELAEDDQHDDGEAEQEDELADRACVPADDRDRRARVAAAGVPAHERREHEHEPREGGHALTRGPDAARDGKERVAATLAWSTGGGDAQADRARKAPRVSIIYKPNVRSIWCQMTMLR